MIKMTALSSNQILDLICLSLHGREACDKNGLLLFSKLLPWNPYAHQSLPYYLQFLYYKRGRMMKFK